MTRKITLLLAAIVGFLSGCSGITVSNKTRIPVRVIVYKPGGRDVLSPSPGESSTTDAEEGSYRAVAIADAEWIEYAKATRKFLNDQLSNPDLSGPQLLDVIRRLKEVAGRMAEYEKAAKATETCFGYHSDTGPGLVTVTIGSTGGLLVACR